jgi:imidazolonepropionase-like amidohydrolase
MTATAHPQSSIMFRNVRIFNGTDPALSEPSDVIVTGNLITQIRPTAVNPAPQPSQQVLDGTGKTLIPGLIDAHVHLMFAALAPQDAADLSVRGVPLPKRRSRRLSAAQ